MKPLLILITLFLFSINTAIAQERYLEGSKVLYEAPEEADVLKVNTSLGFCTVLEFKEKPMLVTVGDNSLIQVEIPQNSKSVVIKPLQQSGETNLFVFTPSQRFNYKVVIADPANVDYVVDTKDSIPEVAKGEKEIGWIDILNLARNYPILKDIKAVNNRKLTRKDLFYSYSYPKFKIDFIESFSRKNPNYVVLHIVINNTTNNSLKLIEQNTNLFIGKQLFIPHYILFDAHILKANTKTDGWLVLEDTHISTDNKFECQIGFKEQDNVWYTDIS